MAIIIDNATTLTYPLLAVAAVKQVIWKRHARLVKSVVLPSIGYLVKR